MGARHLFIGIFLLLISTAVRAPAFAGEYVPQAAAEALEKSQGQLTVRVPLTTGSEEISHGSAFLVHPQGLIVTAFHLVPKIANAGSFFFKGIPATVALVYPAADLALLKLERVPEGMSPAILASDAQLFTKVYARMSGVYFFDETNALTYILFRGEIVGRAAPVASTPDGEIQVQADVEFLYIDNVFKGGFSGGMMVNEKGEVVGVNHAYEGGYAIAVHVKAVRRLLETYLSQQKNTPESKER